jgi:hypothetical protein
MSPEVQRLLDELRQDLPGSRVEVVHDLGAVAVVRVDDLELCLDPARARPRRQAPEPRTVH